MEANDLSSMISAITSDPAMMSRVMGALSSLSAGNNDPAPEREEPERKPESDTTSAVSDKKRLLVALKPYLSPNRREKAEMLINVMALLDSGILNMLGKGE